MNTKQKLTSVGRPGNPNHRPSRRRSNTGQFFDSSNGLQGGSNIMQLIPNFTKQLLGSFSEMTILRECSSMLRRALFLVTMFLWPVSNSAQVGGLAPQQTASNPLQLRISDGDISSILGTFQFKATSVILPANNTSYIYLDLTTAPPVLTVNQTGFPAILCYKIATVTTNLTQVVGIIDSRPPFNSTVTGQGAQNFVTNTFTASQNFDADVHTKGPNPTYDIMRYGAQPDNVTGLGGATCTSGLPTVTLNSAYGFANLEGVAVRCGPMPSLPTPAAPTVTTGNVEGLMVPNSQLNSATGSSSFTYWLVYASLNGGLSVAGAQTTIANGLTLGMQGPVSVTSSALVEHTLTITFRRTPRGLATGAHFSFDGSTNQQMMTAKSQVTSVTATTVVATVANYCETGQTCTGTGGTFNWANGNRISFTLPASPVWKAYICGQRPGDSSGHVIGATDPILANYAGYGGYEVGINPAMNNWTDYGATVSQIAAPSGSNGGTFPYYVTDAICTNASVQPEFLYTTIVSGAGTTSLVLAASAGSNRSSVDILSDAGPNWQAADIAAFGSSNKHGSVTVPDIGSVNSQRFITHMPLNLHALTYLNGNVLAGDTIDFHGDLVGARTGANCPQFAWDCFSVIQSAGAYPLVIMTGQPQTLNTVSLSAPIGKAVLAAQTNNNRLNDVGINTASGSNDYCGMALEVVPEAFNFRTWNLTILNGPNQTADASWCPGAFYMNNSGAGNMIASLEGRTFAGVRGFYFDANTWTFNLELDAYYSQGPIFPPINVFNVNNPVIRFKSCFQELDTSVQAILDVENLGGGGLSSIDACGLVNTSSGGGLPFTGTLQGMPTINRNPQINGSGLTPPAMFGPGVLSYNSRGQLAVSSHMAIGTQPTISGTGACATISTQIGGSWAGKVTCTGTTGASTITFTPVQYGGALTPLNGWACNGSDETAGTSLTQSADTQTGCTLKGTVNANDVITFNLFSF